jgi:hypothetical protein
MPLLANSFLFVALICLNLPGSMSFVLLESVLHVVPINLVLLLVLVAFALSGIALAKTYTHLFHGKPVLLPQLDMRKQEVAAFLLWSVAILSFGLL